MENLSYKGLDFVPYISREEIAIKVKELAKMITCDCQGKNPLFVCVLNGAFAFASDLFREVEMDAQITFIRLKSYIGTGSCGKVKVLSDFTEDITGRTIIIVEDIVDTGKTMKRLISDMEKLNPAEIKVASLFFKPESLQCDITIDYVGFNIPNKFIIGYGLDIDEMARNLPSIYILKSSD
ncbi:MAG: hypoxanthine phosphoribosyltransferase [Bacteroidales bacterium]|nr:hypoxanthine phosphoribosyltransferase [Bacteroidales bacterium]